MKIGRQTTDSNTGQIARQARANDTKIGRSQTVTPKFARAGNRRRGVIFGWLILGVLCFSVSAQKSLSDAKLLAGWEKSIEQGKLAETERPLLDYARSHAQDARVLELVGRLRLRQGRLEEAKSLYLRVLTLDEKFTAAKINYGILLFQTGQVSDARAVLNEVNPAEVTDAAMRLNLVRGLTLVGEFQKALTIIETLPANLKTGEALPYLAVCYLELGEKQKIEQLLPAARKSAATSPSVAVKFAEALLNYGLSAPPVELLRTVAANSPKNVKALILLGRAEILTKDFAAAKQHLARAAVLEPQRAEVFLTQAMLENAQGNVKAAFALLEKARNLEPDSRDVLLQFITTAMRINQPQKGIEAAERLLRINPDEPDFLYLYGAASLQNGRIEAAQKSLERFTQLRPQDSRGCLALGLTLAAQRDQIEPARRQLHRCLEINPANYEAKYQLGLSYKAQGDTATAVRWLEETVALAPNNALALRDLGAVYLQAGEESKARGVLEKSFAIEPQDAETNFQLSRLYNLIGEAALAKKHLEIFQKLRNSGGNSMP